MAIAPHIKELMNSKDASVIRKMFEEGALLKKEFGEDKVYDFTLGNPSVPCPEKVTEVIADEIKNPMVHGYTSAQGNLSARQAIVEYNKNKYGFELNADLTYLTCGAAAGLAIASSVTRSPLFCRY